MPTETLLSDAELYFRTYLHATLPLHASLVEAVCDAQNVPLDLATVLEDIGQGYMRLADTVNAALIRHGSLGNEIGVEHTNETRIDNFVGALTAGAGKVELCDGRVIDARRAIEAFPGVASAVRAALLIEMSQTKK